MGHPDGVPHFSPASRGRCAAHGIDIEESYRCLLLEIRCGGRVGEHLTRDVLTLSRHPQHSGGATKQMLSQHLTPTETTVLQAHADLGQSRRVAAVLGLSLHTVRVHLRNTYPKLDARTAAQAVAVAWRAGLID